MACSSEATVDKFEGTWAQTWIREFSQTADVNELVIKRNGDGYVLTGPDGNTEQGYVLRSRPDASGTETVYCFFLGGSIQVSEDGDALEYTNDSSIIEITVSDDVMTMDTPGGEEEVFEFTRTGTQ